MPLFALDGVGRVLGPCMPILTAAMTTVFPTVAGAQIDQQQAQRYFKDAEALCAREGGRLWGVTLCGPMVFADAATRTIATNQPAPQGSRPPALGFANAAMDWGGARWSTFVWQMIPADDEHARGRLMLPAPIRVETTELAGDGWTLTLAAGWVARPGARPGDFEVVRER